MRWLCVAALLAACRPGADEGLDTGDTAIDGCRAGPGPEERVVLVSHPYASDPTLWEVLALDGQGALVQTGETVSIGRATNGVVAFTPDGSLGFAVLEDGELAVIAVEDGGVSVLRSGAFEDLYVSGVAVHPSGERALILDGNWRKNGGTVVEVAIDCANGGLTELRRVPSKLANAALPWGSEQWVVAAVDLGASPTADVHLLDEDGYGGAALFPDEDAIVSSVALAEDLVIVADYNAFAGGNRLGIGRIGEQGIAPISVVPGVEDPVSVAIAPDASVGLVASGFGDALLALSIDASASQPVQLLGELEYEGSGPALPGGIATVPGLSMAFVAENLGVRPVVFANGAIEDQGLFALGSGTDSVVGAIGAQP